MLFSIATIDIIRLYGIDSLIFNPNGPLFSRHTPGWGVGGGGVGDGGKVFRTKV